MDLRVLLVEDNPINQEVALELLREQGLAVDTAVDGAIALEMAGTRRYDLVLMDIQMPVMDGLQATREMRRRGLKLPIVAVTALNFGEDRAACLAAGMNDHISKPVDPVRLQAVLRRWLPAPRAPSAAAPATPASLADRLAAVPGLDVARGLRNLGGSTAALERVLKRFVATYREGEPALESAPDAAQRPAWRSACHSLRGACATVGAEALQAQAHALEQALDEGCSDEAFLAAQGRALQTALGALIASLGTALAP